VVEIIVQIFVITTTLCGTHVVEIIVQIFIITSTLYGTHVVEINVEMNSKIITKAGDGTKR
jgi:hypothetical protein